jgi:type I restriction enzyme M protein
MITGSLKNKIDAIRQDFYNENMAQGSDVVNQLTTLMFIKMLDDRQNSLEAQAIIAGLTPKQDDLIFKNGNYINEEENINIPYEKLRWKNFKNLNSKDLSKTIRDYCYPFIKDENTLAGKDFARFTKNMTYGFDGKERLLVSVVDKLSDAEFDFTKYNIIHSLF